MIERKGYVKKRRGILNHLYENIISTTEYLIYDILIMEADFNTGLVGNTSAPYIANMIKMSTKTVKRSLIMLESKNYIKRFIVKGSHNPYPILINKYDVDNKGSVSCDKTNNINNIVYMPNPEVSLDLSPEVSPDESLEVSPNRRTKEINNIINNIGESDNLKQAVRDFVEMRRKIRKNPTEKALQMIIGKLERLSKGDIELKISILDQSTINSWQDVFELRQNNNGNTKRNHGSYLQTKNKNKYENV